MSDPVKDREVLLSIDPAQTVDMAGHVLMRLEDISPAGAVGRILGCSRSRRVTYDEQSAQIVRAVERLHDRGARGVNVVIDATGVGRGLLDMVRAASPLTSNTIGISIHGGSKSFLDKSYNIIRVSKVSCVSFLDASFAGSRIVYHPQTPGIGILESEIANLRANTTASGNVTIEAGRGNDDVAFALAQGWYAVASSEIGTPIWSAANVAYFERLSEARAPVELDYVTQVMPLSEPADNMLPPRRAPYRFRVKI
jgi:hypothetical protein